jgi:steroid delta-isomerase-like uncharacterized protein
MNGQDNVSVVAAFWEAVARDDEAALRQVLAPEVAVYNPAGSERQDRATFIQGLLAWSRAFSGNRFEIEDQLCEGNAVVTRGTMRAVHDAAAFQGIAPSGKAIAVPGITIDRISDGAIVERHVCSDRLSLMMQLGQVPAPRAGTGGGGSAGVARGEQEDGPAATKEDVKSISGRYFAACQRNDQAGLRELVSPGVIAHQPGLPAPLSRDGLLAMIDAFGQSFSDEQYTIEEQVADGDRVATRVTWRAVHSGPFQGLAATGRPVAVGGIAISRIEDGRIAERWLQMDQVGMLRQLGLVP